MFRLSLFILLCQISAYSGIPQWFTRVEVTVLDKYNYLPNSEVETLFDDYGKRHGSSSSDMHFRRVKNCNGVGGSPAGFEAYVTSCNDFQTYLLHFGKWLSRRYDWKMIHVKCDSLHFKLCLLPSCEPKDYIDLAKCAYNYPVQLRTTTTV